MTCSFTGMIARNYVKKKKKNAVVPIHTTYFSEQMSISERMSFNTAGKYFTFLKPTHTQIEAI